MSTSPLQATAEKSIPSSPIYSGGPSTLPGPVPAAVPLFVPRGLSASHFYSQYTESVPTMDALAAGFQGIHVDQPHVIPSSGHTVDVREFRIRDRMMLAQSPGIYIYVGEMFVAQVPQGLFFAMSTIPSLVVNSCNTLPLTVEPTAVVKLANYVKNLPYSTGSFPRMDTTDITIHGMLSIHLAGGALGIKRYVEHAYRKVEAILFRDLPTYKDLDAVIHYSHYHGRLLEIAARGLAVKVWERTISDPDELLVTCLIIWLYI
jgi:hypothetical protein